MPQIKLTNDLITAAAAEFGRHVEFLLAPTCLYFQASRPEGSLMPRAHAWSCIFSYMSRVQAGATAAFSRDKPGCLGAVSYFGFNSLPVIPAALFLSGKERLKKDAAMAAAFYHGVEPEPAPDSYLIFSRLDSAAPRPLIEVVNLWVGISALSALHTLANYDRAGNDNVIMPFASGCQSLWTLPFKEKTAKFPRAVAGSLDPTVRRFLAGDVISFSVPAGRLVEMCANIPGSFLQK